MNAQTITIRRLGPEDAGVLKDVAEGVFDAPPDPEFTRAFFAAPGHEMVVAMVDDTVVGMATAVVYHHPDKAPQMWINEVGTGDDWLRRGIALKLMRTMLGVARARGCTTAWLATEGDNDAARALYTSGGGREMDGASVFFWDLG